MGSRYTKMAIDFGTCNTIVTFWDREQEDFVLHHVPDVTLPFRFRQDGKEKEIPYIPSMIYYENRFTNYIGFQMMEKALENSQGAFRWIKAYIQQGRNMQYPLSDGSRVDYFQERGVPRFSVSFRVDGQKRLLVTVRDILTQKLLYEDYPVVKLR